MKINQGYRFVKRTGDFVISLTAILLLSWFFILMIIINFFCAYGRPLYFDKRVGRHGKPIKVLKFTSMKYDADTNPERYLNKKQMKQWKKERKVPNDPRVTKFGKILRKTSIDELPQLFNILVGTLSLVGPRPITESELMKNFTPEEREKLLLVKPGLTGNWAVSGRNNVEFKDHSRQTLELEYIDKISFKTDISILFRTFGAVLRFNDVK